MRPRSGDKAAAEAAKAEVAKLKEKTAGLQAQQKELEEELVRHLCTIPNIPNDDVPEGAGAEDNVVVKEGGLKPELGNDALPHWELAKKYKARVMVDDAHGFGVLGPGGRGTAAYFGLTDEVDITMLTFSKSLASIGGCMLTKHQVCEYLRHVSRPFIFSASITPSSAATALASLRKLEADPERPARLMQAANFFREQLSRRASMSILSSHRHASKVSACCAPR